MTKTKIAAGRYEVTAKGATFFLTENTEYSRNDDYRWTAHLNDDFNNFVACGSTLRGCMEWLSDYIAEEL